MAARARMLAAGAALIPAGALLFVLGRPSANGPPFEAPIARRIAATATRETPAESEPLRTARHPAIDSARTATTALPSATVPSPVHAVTVPSDPEPVSPKPAHPSPAAPGDATALASPSQAADPAVIERGAPMVEHTLWTADRDGIRNAIAESMDDFRSCYTQWLALDPTIAGKIAVAFTVTSGVFDGGVAAREEEPVARITGVHLKDSSIGHVFMEGCVEHVFSELRFTPPPEGVLNVTYPLVFDAKNRGDGED